MTLLDQLAETHRQRQRKIYRGFFKDFVRLWDLLSWSDLDGTYEAWAHQVLDSIRKWRQESAEAAVTAHLKMRVAAAPELETPPPVAVFRDGKTSFTFDNKAALSVPEQRKLAVVEHRRAVKVAGRDRVQVDWSDPKPAVIEWPEEDRRAERVLRIVGPGELKRRSGHGESEREAKNTALVIASGEAQRQVARGQRKTTMTMVRADQAALGWARVTGSSATGPCAFCVMLASRGPVYGSSRAAGFEAHGNCQCTAVAVFNKDSYAGRDNELEWAALWKEATKGYSGRDARNAFRRHWEGLRREAKRAAAA